MVMGSHANRIGRSVAKVLLFATSSPLRGVVLALRPFRKRFNLGNNGLRKIQVVGFRQM